MRRTADEPLFNSLMEQYHYLAYEQPVGEHLKYLAWAQGRPIACLAWSSAPRHLGSRDRYIGWNAEARRRNIRFIAYNTRFLILPWVRVPHLASHILGEGDPRSVRRLGADVRPSDLLRGNLHRSRTFSRNLLPRGQLATARAHYRARQERPDQQAEPPDQGSPRLALDAAFPRVSQPVMTMQTADRREPGRTGSDHRSQHACAAERIGRPEAQNRAPCHGRETGAETEYGENQCRSAAGWGAGRQAGDRRIGSGRSWAQWRRGVYRRQSGCRRTRHAPFRRPVPGVPPGKSVPPERTGNAGEVRGARTAGSNRVRDGATTLQCVRGGLHRRGTGDGGRRQVR